MTIRFFHSTSYSTHKYSVMTAIDSDLTITHPIGVRAYVEKDSGVAFNPDFYIPDIFRVRKDLANTVAFYGDRLAKLDPVSFYYLSEHQRLACEEELLHTFYVVSAEYQLHLFEGSHHRVNKRLKQLQRCANLLNTLRNTPSPGARRTPEHVLQDAVNQSEDKPAAYVGLILVAPLIAETMLSLTTAQLLKSVKKAMSDANFYRLNWVWGGGLDRILLDLIPERCGRSEQAHQVFSEIAPVTGYMSWVLYYSRLGIELYLLARYTIKNSWLDPWATDENKAVPLGIAERFKGQWEFRKFAILNDIFWATANMACFFWLIGSGTLGYMGNALTGVLLIFDLSLVAWGYQENTTDHNNTMSQFNLDISKINEDIAAKSKDIATKSDEIKLNVLKEHVAVLIEARDKCQLDWDFAEKKWKQDVYYAIGLFATFSILCCFFFPPAALLPATALILGVVGAALSFMITIGAHAWATSLEIEKLNRESQKNEEKIVQMEVKKERLMADERPESIATRQGIELEINHRRDQLSYQKAMIDFHQKEMIQQILSEALVPAIAFAILVFMPLGTGLLVLIPTVAVLMMSGQLLGLYEPEEPDSPADEMPAALPGSIGP